MAIRSIVSLSISGLTEEMALTAGFILSNKGVIFPSSTPLQAAVTATALRVT